MSVDVVKVTGSWTISTLDKDKAYFRFYNEFTVFKSAIIYSSYERQFLRVFHKIFNRFSIEKFC